MNRNGLAAAVASLLSILGCASRGPAPRADDVGSCYGIEESLDLEALDLRASLAGLTRDVARDSVGGAGRLGEGAAGLVREAGVDTVRAGGAVAGLPSTLASDIQRDLVRLGRSAAAWGRDAARFTCPRWP